MGIGSPKLQRQLVSAAIALAFALAVVPHARAALDVADQAAAVVQAASAPVAEAVAQPSAVVAQAVETAQPAVAAPVATVRDRVHTTRPIHRAAPAVREVVRAATPVLDTVAAVSAPVVRTVVNTAVAPLKQRAAAVPQHRAAAPKAPAAPSRAPHARVSRANTAVQAPEFAAKPALLAVTSVAALQPRRTGLAHDVVRLPQRPLTLSSFCFRDAGAASGGAGGGSAGAALRSLTAPALPLAVQRLLAPTDAPRSHVSVLCLERPD